MRIKTSVTLSAELLHAIDAQAGQRSAFIEAAAWAYLRARERERLRRARPRDQSSGKERRLPVVAALDEVLSLACTWIMDRNSSTVVVARTFCSTRH